MAPKRTNKQDEVKHLSTELRLGPGEYLPNDSRIYTTHYAQIVFLLAIEDLCPEVLISLQKEPFVLYEAALNEAKSRFGVDIVEKPRREDSNYSLSSGQTYRNSVHYGDLFWSLLGENPLAWTRNRRLELIHPTDPQGDFFPYLLQFHQSVLAWAKGWNLGLEWFFYHVQRTLDDWYDEGVPENLRWSLYHLPLIPVTSVEELEFEFRTRGWDPILETRIEAQLRIEADLHLALNKHFEKINALLHQYGYRPTPKKRQDEHFDWLVHYQIQYWKRSDIAAYYHTSIDNVEKVLKKMAKLVDLKLRWQSPPGRPRKKP